MEPSELALLTREARMVWEALGDHDFYRPISEKSNIVFRRSIFYINEKTIITREIVINYIYELPVGYIVKLLKVK